jgi:hypothetical protein
MKIVAPNVWIKRSNSNLASWLGTQLSTDELELSKLEAKGSWLEEQRGNDGSTMV